MKPINILHVIDSLGERGGAERKLALEVGALAPERFVSHVCYLHPPDDRACEFRSMRVPLYNLNVQGKGQWIFGIRKLRRLVKSLDIDLIHTSLYEADIIGGIAGRLNRVPVVSTLTNTCYEPEWLIDNPHLSRLKLAISRLSRALVARYCDRHIIAISEAVKTSAIKQLGLRPDKISVIHRALSPYWLEEEVPRTAYAPILDDGLLDGFPILINAARLEPQKGQRYIIEAMPCILKQFPKALLRIAGEGSLRNTLTALTNRLGVQDHVIFLGQRNDLRKLFETSDIFVFPSLFEGLGNALVEAMAMGLPSVVSNIETLAEVTQGGKLGLLVPPADARALAHSVVDLASRPTDAKHMGLQAKVAARDRFNLKHVITERASVYQRIAR